MGMYYTAPTLSRTLKNPAEQLVTDSRMILGVTIPTYNDIPIDSPTLYARIASAAIGGKVSGGKTQILRIFSFLHKIGFEVDLVVDGPWVANCASTEKFRQILNLAEVRASSEAALLLTANADVATFNKLEIRPNTSYHSVYEQSLYHELQHCIDFREAAKTIFEPYSNWTDNICKQDKPFTYKEGTTKDWILQAGKGGLSMQLIKYYYEGTQDLGTSFHSKPHGKPPKLKLLAIEDKKMVLQLIEPPKAPVDFWRSPPHGHLQFDSFNHYDSISRCQIGMARQPIKDFALTQEEIDSHENPDEPDMSGFWG